MPSSMLPYSVTLLCAWAHVASTLDASMLRSCFFMVNVLLQLVFLVLLYVDATCTGSALHVLRQRLAPGLRQKRREQQPDQIDEADRHGRMTVAAKACDQRARDERSRPREQPRYVETEGDRGAAHTCRIELGEP